MNLPTHSTFEQGTAHLRANFLDPPFAAFGPV